MMYKLQKPVSEALWTTIAKFEERQDAVITCQKLVHCGLHTKLRVISNTHIFAKAPKLWMEVEDTGQPLNL